MHFTAIIGDYTFSKSLAEASNELEKKFIDEAYREWTQKFNPGLVEILKRTYEAWDQK